MTESLNTLIFSQVLPQEFLRLFYLVVFTDTQLKQISMSDDSFPFKDLKKNQDNYKVFSCSAFHLHNPPRSSPILPRRTRRAQGR